MANINQQIPLGEKQREVRGRGRIRVPFLSREKNGKIE